VPRPTPSNVLGFPSSSSNFSKRTRRGIQFVEHTEGDGREMFKAVCKLGFEGIVSKKLNAPYRSGPSKTWIKVKNPKAPAATFDVGPWANLLPQEITAHAYGKHNDDNNHGNEHAAHVCVHDLNPLLGWLLSAGGN